MGTQLGPARAHRSSQRWDVLYGMPVAARVGGAPMGRGAFRVAFWGALAMAASAGVGRLFGTQVP